MIPRMTDVESSNIAQVGYDPLNQALHVKFKTGSHYKYGGVAQEAYDGLLASDSKGSHLRQHIIGKHDPVRVA